MSLRYFAGYSLHFLAGLLEKGPAKIWRVASLPRQFALIIWTPSEIARYSRADWNGWPTVQGYARTDHWLDWMEQALVERYFPKNGELLNLACGAGREALLLARRGLRVTACDWSPPMIAEAQRRARESNLPVRFAVADLYYPLNHEKAVYQPFLSNYYY